MINNNISNNSYNNNYITQINELKFKLINEINENKQLTIEINNLKQSNNLLKNNNLELNNKIKLSESKKMQKNNELQKYLNNKDDITSVKSDENYLIFILLVWEIKI